MLFAGLAEQTVTPEDVFQVTGRADLVCAAVELCERQGDWISRQLVTARSLKVGALHAQLPQASPIYGLLDKMTARRADVADLKLNRARIMGIVNVTPDSFSDGGKFEGASQAIEHALELDDEGADILDIGGESTRPGAEPISVGVELSRVIPVIEAVSKQARARISIDTRKAEVMKAAVEAGAHIVNDVSALGFDPMALRTVSALNVPVILMHSPSDPTTMQNDPKYDDVLLDVFDALSNRIEICEDAGIPRDRIMVDPGIGFGKTVDHNKALIANIGIFHALGVPIVLGASRKSFIGAITGAMDPSERVYGSIAAALSGAYQGAQIIRVHDVAATKQAFEIFNAGRTALGANKT